MATISGYDSSSIGVLFSSLNSGRTNTSTMFGTSDLLGINYSDYATIRNGSYTKLMKAYYKKAASMIRHLRLCLLLHRLPKILRRHLQISRALQMI